VNPENKIDNADEKTKGAEQDTTGTIVSGSAAHETAVNVDQSEPDLTQAGEKTKGAEQDTTGTIVAGSAAHETEGNADR
jgi:hypothetical protein